MLSRKSINYSHKNNSYNSKKVVNAISNVKYNNNNVFENIPNIDIDINIDKRNHPIEYLYKSYNDIQKLNTVLFTYDTKIIMIMFYLRLTLVMISVIICYYLKQI
jgi:hypothetical protein